MGNFVFDQWFSKETQLGLVTGGIIEENKITLSFFPIQIKKMMPELARGSVRQEILSRVLDGITGENVEKIRDDTVVINIKT
jgi:hypothetical protein